MGANVIMVASGKGGTGKSTVAVLLGAELAARGRRVLLVELDSGPGAAWIISRAVYGKTVYDVEDVLNGRCEAARPWWKALCQRNLYVISAPYSGGHILPAALRVFVEKVGPVFDTIVLDTAAGMGVPFEAAMGVAHRALLVLTPDPVSIRDGRIVCRRAGGGRVPEIRLIINKVPRTLANCGIQSLDECIDTVGAQLIGVVPFSTEIQKAGATGAPLAPAGQAPSGAARHCRTPVRTIYAARDSINMRRMPK